MVETTIENKLQSDAQKELLYELISKACGPRSLSEFAKSCGISPAHVCRIKNGMRPTKKMIMRMLSDAYVKEIGMTCEEFYKAAGIDDKAEIESAQRFEKVVSKQNDTKALGTIAKKLMESQYRYQLLPVGDNVDVDFAFMVVNGRKKTKWNFVLNQEDLISVDNRSVNAVFHNLGRLLSFPSSRDEQYTMVFQNEDAYDQLIKLVNPEQVLAKVSVVLLDSEQMRIEKEAFFGPDRIEVSLSE